MCIEQWRREDFEPGGTTCVFTKSGGNHRNFYINMRRALKERKSAKTVALLPCGD